MRILVYGNSGSGKSTYARALAERHSLPQFDLDTIVWEPGLIAVPRPSEAIEASLAAYLAEHSRWVIEGCYGELVAIAAGSCTQLVFLDPGLAVCLANNRRRSWEPHKYGTREQQDSMLPALQDWVADYYVRSGSWSYAEHRRLFASHEGVKVEYTARPPID